MYNKIEVFSSDYGSAYQYLRANTQKMEMTAGLEALRSETRRAREAEKLERNEAPVADLLAAEVRSLEAAAARGGYVVNLAAPKNHKNLGADKETFGS